YREVGPFDPALLRCQDYEMAVRVARRFPCARVAGPTIYYRMHGGTRGSARDTFQAGQIQEKWLGYMQIFIRKLRKDMPLCEYLPGRQGAYGRPSDLRYAYLRRMAIMARKRLYDEMIEDLRLATQENSSDFSTLASREQHLLRELFNFINDPLFFQKDVLRRIRSVCRGPVGSAIRGELIRCLYWDLIHTVRKGTLSQSFSTASAAMQLSGIGVFRSFLHNWKSQWRAPGPILL